jgi:triphosphatase
LQGAHRRQVRKPSTGAYRAALRRRLTGSIAGVASPELSGAGVLEVEWQFDALDLRPVERWLASLGGRAGAPPPPGRGSRDPAPPLTVSPRRGRRLVDVYLDTDDWRVRRAGYVLRVRQGPSGAEATLKAASEAASGPRRRLEITEHLDGQDPQALVGDGPVGRRVHAVRGSRPLRRLLEVRTHRRPYDLFAGDRRIAEVALDDTVVAAGSLAPLRLRRVEVEVTGEVTGELTSFVERLRRENALRRAILSKFEAGLLSAGLAGPQPPDVGPTAIPDRPTLGEVAYAVLRRTTLAMLAHEPGTRLGEDPEELHDMRVATRRLRAALSLFAEALPVRAGRIRDELGWLAGLLGGVRDLDVELDHMEQWRAEMDPEDRDAVADLSARLDQHRDEARRALLGSLDSARYQRLVSALVSVLQRGPSRRLPAARALAVAAVPDLVGARHQAASKAARRARRSGLPSDCHRLRIRTKRLRYALEFVAEVYQEKSAGFVRQLVGLQDALGLLQDSEVARARLRAQVLEAGSGLKPHTVFVMGMSAERHRRQAEQLRQSLPQTVKVLNGAQWRRLESLLDRRRAEAQAQATPAVAPAAPPTAPGPG